MPHLSHLRKQLPLGNAIIGSYVFGKCRPREFANFGSCHLKEQPLWGFFTLVRHYLWKMPLQGASTFNSCDHRKCPLGAPVTLGSYHPWEKPPKGAATTFGSNFRELLPLGIVSSGSLICVICHPREHPHFRSSPLELLHWRAIALGSC